MRKAGSALFSKQGLEEDRQKDTEGYGLKIKIWAEMRSGANGPKCPKIVELFFGDFWNGKAKRKRKEKKKRKSKGMEKHQG